MAFIIKMLADQVRDVLYGQVLARQNSVLDDILRFPERGGILRNRANDLPHTPVIVPLI